MIKRTWVLAFSVYYLLFICGCTSTRQIAVEGENIPTSGEMKIIRVILKSGDIIRFDHDGGRIVERVLETRLYRTIVGVTTEDRVVELDPENATEILVEKKEGNTLGTIFVILGVVAAIGAGVLGYLISQIH